MLNKKLVLLAFFVFISYFFYVDADLKENRIDEIRKSQQDISVDDFIDDEIYPPQIADVCEGHVCENEGVCYNVNNAPKCFCFGNFIGDKCEKDVCENDPCKNGGKCSKRGTTFECFCTGTWTGATCELDVCEGHVCENEGVCYNLNNAAKCICFGNFIGDKCEEDVCEGYICENEGVCYNADGSPKCSCTESFIGNKCEISVCAIAPCKNGGECFMEGNTFKCACFGTWAGATCEEDVCANHPCRNGGKCSKEGNGFKCTCRGKWGGATCEQECDCGPKGTCEFKNGKKNCECHEYYADKNGKCTETCEDGECEYGTECVPFGGYKFCKCTRGLSGDRCEIKDDCAEKGKFRDCKQGRGRCEYDVIHKNATCACYGGTALDLNAGYCKETCEKDDECNGGKCVGKGGEKICICKWGLGGDKCNIVLDCLNGKYRKCEESGGTCTFDGTKAACMCPEEKILDEREPLEHFCRGKCNVYKNDCKNGGNCDPQTKLCMCNYPNTSGDKCENIEGCGPLNCEAINADCFYDVVKFEPTCKCRDDNYYYENRECKAKWCKNGGGCNPSISTCQYKDGVGSCKCRVADNYYLYSWNICIPIDKCFRVKCGENEVCISGVCKCRENYKLVNNTCERQELCKRNKCFFEANCEESKDSGLVKCFCKSDSKFYSNGSCQDGNCFLPGHRKGCWKSCPTGMTRNKEDGECKYNDVKNKCERYCGFLGWCYKAADAESACVCDPNYAELSKSTKKCVLKATVCPNRQRDGDRKCNCTGKYKLAGNGITCDLRSCSDEDVQKECKTKGAEKCVDDWKGDGYRCVCPVGYIDHKQKGCLDPCDFGDIKATCFIRGQTCYIGDRLRVADCRCPPSFTYEAETKSCEISSADTFMIPSLPVLKKRYAIDENTINKVTLSQDVINAMTATYNKLEFAQLYNYKVEKDVIRCDVWLQFKPANTGNFNATLEVKRWLYQLIELEGKLLLPPRLLMGTDIRKAMEEERLTLCNPTVLQDVCGRGSSCDEVKGCSCAAGYKEIPSTIKSSAGKRLVRCEDIDECFEGSHKCSANSTCVNTLGDYFCMCDPGFKKAKGEANALDKEACVSICSEDKCVHGKCEMIDNNFNCRCTEGYTGITCAEKIEAKKMKLELWQILVISLIVGICVLLSGLLCIWIFKKPRK